jgi:hypothetical protein
VSSKINSDKGIDRINWLILINNIPEGGLNSFDFECLNKSLNLRQFVTANRFNHPVKMIKQYCMEQIGYNSVIKRVYDKITKKEEITRIAQININNLCDLARKTVIGNWDNYTEDSMY